MANSTDRQAPRPELAPSWLSRAQRRYVDRTLRKLIRRNVCSLCGGAFKHNTRTATGFDVQGDVAVACENCIDHLAEIFALGLYSDRKYDFLSPSGSEVPPERIAEALEAHIKTIAETDRLLADVERHGGAGMRASKVNFADTPWKPDDDNWFRQNPSRSHRVRMPFPNECDEEAAKAPIGSALIILIRQAKPGARLRAGVYFSVDLLPVPNDEATIHALFEVAMQREPAPSDRQALRALANKYAVAQEPSQ
jgi:hypothetical protein